MNILEIATQGAKALEAAVKETESKNIKNEDKTIQAVEKQENAINIFLEFYDGLDNVFGFPFYIDMAVKAALPFLINYVHGYLFKKEGE